MILIFIAIILFGIYIYFKFFRFDYGKKGDYGIIII